MWGSADGVTLHNSWCLRSDWFSKTKAWRLLNTVQFAWMHLRESSHDKDQRLVFAYRYLNSIVFEKNLKIRTLFIKIPSTKMKQCYGKILQKWTHIFVEMWDVCSIDVLLLFQADYVLWGNYHILEFSEARNVCVCDFLCDLFIFMFVTDLWRFLGF